MPPVSDPASAQASAAPRLTKGERTKQRIFDAAFELFGTRGFNGVSLRDIAAQVGVTHVTVLHYFTSKDELLAQLMVRRDEVDQRAAQQFIAATAHTPAEHGLRSPLLRWFMHRLEHNAIEPGATPLFLKISTEATDPEHPAHEHFRWRYEYIRERLVDAFEEELSIRSEGCAAVDPRMAAEQFVAIADGMQIQAIYAGDPARVVAAAWDYLRLIGIADRT